MNRSIRTTRLDGRRRAAFAAIAGIALCLAPVAGAAQDGYPFFAGEKLTYRLQMGILGTIGSGTMTVEGPVEVRGTSTLLLRSDFRSSVMMVKGVDETRSWLDPVRMSSLRFQKHERTPLNHQDSKVEMFGTEGRWTADDGSSGRSDTRQPLDELSFIYFVRTLPLEAGASFSFDRHFDTARNPITVRVVGRETIRVGAGEFSAWVVEMRVQDPARYKGEGVIRIHLSDGACRLPLRIESRVPSMGKTVLSLEAHTHPASHFAVAAN